MSDLDPNFAELGQLLYELVNERTGKRDTDFYTAVVEQLMSRGRLVTLAQAHAWTNVANDRSERHLQTATDKIRQTREHYQALALTVRQDMAAMLRDRADNPRLVTGKYRRDGVLLAAEWLYPDKPEDVTS